MNDDRKTSKTDTIVDVTNLVSGVSSAVRLAKSLWRLFKSIR